MIKTKDSLILTMKNNEKFFKYGHDENFGQKCMEFLEENKIIKFDNDLQRNFYETMFSYMDTITAIHSIETASIAKQLVKKYGEGKFKNDFNIDKDSLVKGMLLHDCGKIFVDYNALMTSKKFNRKDSSDLEKIEEIKTHTSYFDKCLMIINEKANFGSTLKEVFPNSKITNIGKYHHIDDNLDDLHPLFYNSLYNDGFYMVATQIDVFESMRTDIRTYKESVDLETTLDIIENKINKLPNTSKKYLFRNINSFLESSHLITISDELKEAFKTELVCVERTTYQIDKFFEKLGIIVDMNDFDKNNVTQYIEENKLVRETFGLEK